MVENRSRLNSRMIPGLILVIIGVLFLLDNLNYLYFDLPHVNFFVSRNPDNYRPSYTGQF